MGKRREKSQAAMEYLTTYGWAILVVAVVLVALYAFGIFNVNNLAPRAQPGSCQVYKQAGLPSTLGGQCSTDTLPQFVLDLPFCGSCAGNTGYSGPMSNIIIPFTVSFWTDVISGSGNSNDRFFTFNQENLVIDNNGGSSTSYQIRVPCGTSGCSYPGTGDVFQDNEWYMFTLVFTSTTSVLLYVNGAYYATISPSSADALASTYTNLAISRLGGNGGCTSPCNWNGYMSNIQIYNTSLPASDISSLYNEGIGGAPIDLNYLAGWWPLNGNMNDYSGSGNSGTVYSDASFTSNWTSGYNSP